MFKSYSLLKAGSRQNMFWSEGMEVRDYLNDYLKNYSLKYNKKEPNYFILDSHENLKTYHPSNREDRDFEYYCYSRSFYNKCISLLLGKWRYLCCDFFWFICTYR